MRCDFRRSTASQRDARLEVRLQERARHLQVRLRLQAIVFLEIQFQAIIFPPDSGFIYHTKPSSQLREARLRDARLEARLQERARHLPIALHFQASIIALRFQAINCVRQVCETHVSKSVFRNARDTCQFHKKGVSILAMKFTAQHGLVLAIRFTTQHDLDC